MKKTGWFNENQEPARPGVYETRHWDGSGDREGNFSHWNGEDWSYTARTPSIADHYRRAQGTCGMSKEWRGLTTNAGIQAVEKAKEA